MIYTHLNLDIDAASSVALYLITKRDDNVQFVSADFIPKLEVNDVAIDITAGGMGLKGDKSAFSLILSMSPKKYQLAFEKLAVMIDAYDSTGTYPKVPGYPGVTIIDTFNYLKRGIGLDQELLKAWKPVIEGIFFSWRDFQSATKEANTAEFVGKVAIIKNAPRQTHSILFDKGVEFVVYEDNFNLGVIRNPRSNKNLGNHLRKDLPEWFHHPKGFLSCWGCNKAPKFVASEISAETLAEMVNSL